MRRRKMGFPWVMGRDSERDPSGRAEMRLAGTSDHEERFDDICGVSDAKTFEGKRGVHVRVAVFPVVVGTDWGWPDGTMGW